MFAFILPDGSRKRRQGSGLKAKWYSIYRALRFFDRYGINELPKGESKEELQIRAYYNWLNNGKKHGQDHQDWFQAQRESLRNCPVEIHRAISISRQIIYKILYEK